jgi:hypothetical protein
MNYHLRFQEEAENHEIRHLVSKNNKKRLNLVLLFLLGLKTVVKS